MQNNFVIHFHSGFGHGHYDLMLQQEQALATWQLPGCPYEIDTTAPLPARKLKDHRSEYLTYEGPVSGQRGHVKAVDTGKYELLACNKQRWEILFAGRHMKGRFELIRVIEDQWILRKMDSSS